MPRKKKLPVASGQGVTPYLDVMTVSSSQFPTAQRADRVDHAALLVEPVPLPDLAHTGVKRSVLQGDFSLFYPNGAKSQFFRNTIRDTLQAPALVAEAEHPRRSEGRRRRRRRRRPPSAAVSEASSAWESVYSESSAGSAGSAGSTGYSSRATSAGSRRGSSASQAQTRAILRDLKASRTKMEEILM